MHTLVWLFSCVRPNVLLKVGKLSKLAFTDLTFVRANSSMDPIMLRKIGRVGKAFLADRTVVGLWVLFVDLLRMYQHV